MIMTRTRSRPILTVSVSSTDVTEFPESQSLIVDWMEPEFAFASSTATESVTA